MVEPDVPDEVAAVCTSFLTQIDDAAPGLVGDLFLHGSLCWGEFFADSDIDFVSVLAREPTEADLSALQQIHAHVAAQFPERRFEGFHGRPGALEGSPVDVGPVPVHQDGQFARDGRLDVNWVTWHELAERGIVVRGRLPEVRTDLAALLEFTGDNLHSYWGDQLSAIDAAGTETVGAQDGAVVWVTLGVARLHHLLVTERLTSKSGAGRYVLESLDPRWHRLAEEALALREAPGTPSAYDNTDQRGLDLRDFLAAMIADV